MTAFSPSPSPPLTLRMISLGEVRRLSLPGHRVEIRLEPTSLAMTVESDMMEGEIQILGVDVPWTEMAASGSSPDQFLCLPADPGSSPPEPDPTVLLEPSCTVAIGKELEVRVDLHGPSLYLTIIALSFGGEGPIIIDQIEVDSEEGTVSGSFIRFLP